MYSLYFFSMMLGGGPVGMPARALIPALFAAGAALQAAALRFGSGKKRFLPAAIALGAILLCETVGRLADNGLAEIVVVSFAWSALLGMLAALAVHALRKGGRAHA